MEKFAKPGDSAQCSLPDYGKLHSAQEPHIEDSAPPAKACSASLSDVPQTFTATYGTMQPRRT